MKSGAFFYDYINLINMKIWAILYNYHQRKNSDLRVWGIRLEVIRKWQLLSRASVQNIENTLQNGLLIIFDKKVFKILTEYLHFPYEIRQLMVTI